MKIKSVPQQVGRPIGAPDILNPVEAVPDCLLFYMGGPSPVVWNHPVFCAKQFAETALTAIDAWIKKNEYRGFVHLGFYNPRQARHKDGTPIKPLRWSNHAYGTAVDFKGVVLPSGKFLAVEDFEQSKINQLMDDCRKAMQAQKLRDEIVHEGEWIHIGYFPH